MSRRVILILFCWVLIAVRASAQTTTSETMPSFGSLFSELPGDVMRLGSLRTVIVLGAGGAAALGVGQYDTSMTRHAAGWATAEEVLDPGQIVGGALVQVGGAFATYTLGRIADSPRFASAGAKLVRAQLLNAGLTQALKFAVDRRRPDSGRHSFPSGHSSASFATATILHGEFGWKAGLAAYAAATYVATSRMSENSHYPSDVIFGAAVGMTSAYAVKLGKGSGRVSVSPVVSPGIRAVQIAIHHGDVE